MKLHRFFSTLGLTVVLAGTTYLLGGSPAATAAGGSWEGTQVAYQKARASAQAEDIDRALSLADAYLAAHPNDGRALTYRGSLAALRARISWLPWKKLAFLNEGVQQMDDGVSQVSKASAGSVEEMEVRMVRGITSANIPSTFGRGGVAFSDFKAVIRHPHFSVLPAAQRATVLAWSAVMHQLQGQAAEAERLQREAEALDVEAARKVREQSA